VTPKQEAFVREYLIDLNATAAYKRAGYRARGHSAEVNAERLLRHAEVKAEIQAAKERRAERVEAKADDVLREWLAIGTADPRELIEFRRCCCRYCWGKGNRYQRTPGEMERARAEHRQAISRARDEGKKAPIRFDVQGGVGFNPKRDPNPKCQECFGDGVGETFVHDTRRLSPAAARLYAGVKQTKEGLEVKVRSQDDAQVNIARHLGLFNKDKSGAGVRVIVKDMTGRKRGDSGG